MTTAIRSIGAGALLAATLTTAASAHDFWVQPAQFWLAPNGAVLTSLQVGHGPARERWGADVKRVTSFYSLGPAGRTDRLAELRARGLDQDHLLRFPGPGVHVLVLETNHAQSELPGPRFTSYLKEEGLTPAINLRAQQKIADQPGREVYTRRAKALVQVGPPNPRFDALVTRPVGLSLEIVPEVNPYAPTAGANLPVRILYEGRPLSGALVKLNNLDFDGRPVAQIRSDSAGRAVFNVPRSGSWQLNVIWTKPLKGAAKADFDTTFSSLTFGFPRKGAAVERNP
ncbi:MAG: DUF4198 domain-containing protein [Phenylobacterium sp.]|uniref:DUF4198 domain-containing protein n=1 Tax=Phenylobacterium sp. TaxID=1871053 RepID=UPI00271DE1F6|nr:DUF4198 domain-containing protein [Phenylobacterium sp.]MDO8911225.1 DUF4198 domain-containing protein [Phenylobacterium sp.]MDP3100768.1 DUF4198 domain-containing protein [Phenylobacterium sp.]